MKKFLLNKNRNYIIVTQFINAIIALTTGKLIAIYILPEDFGTYNIQFATYTFFSTLLISPFVQFIKATNKTLLPKIGSKQYISLVIFIMGITYFLFISFLYFYYDIFDFLLYVVFLLFMVLSTFNSIIGNYLNINNQIIDFSKLSIVKSFSGLIFIFIFFIFGLQFMDDTQVLWLMQLMGVLMACIFFVSKYKLFKTRFKIGYGSFFKKYMRFAGPLIFMGIWSWINNYFDRYAIEYYLSTKEVGIYNASYGVGSKFFLMLSPIFMILLIPLVYQVAKKEQKKKAIDKYSFIYFLIGIPILGGIYIFKDSIGGLLLSGAYAEGFYLIFWVALAFFALTLAYIYESYFYAEERTKIILVGNIISAITNILLNIILIPRYGVLGAAIASCIGFTAHFGVMFYNFKRI